MTQFQKHSDLSYCYEDKSLVLVQLQQILKFMVFIFHHQKKILEQLFEQNEHLAYIKMDLEQTLLFLRRKYQLQHFYQTQCVHHIYEQIKAHNCLVQALLQFYYHSLFHLFEALTPSTNSIKHLVLLYCHMFLVLEQLIHICQFYN